MRNLRNTALRLSESKKKKKLNKNAATANSIAEAEKATHEPSGSHGFMTKPKTTNIATSSMVFPTEG